MSFPRDFLWGGATSAHQVEGGNTNNDWSAAEALGRVPPAGLACDSYHRYEEDFDLAVFLGHNAHRLGLEWSRIEPREGQFDMEEVAHYRQVLQALRDRHLKSFVTLWHFTLPTYLSVIPAKAGTQSPQTSERRRAWVLGSRRDASPEDDKAYCGWEDSRLVERFEEYAKFCAQHFGDLVDFWITENEPTQVYASLGYLSGEWPPFKKLSLWLYLRVCWNLGRAHNLAYAAIKRVLPKAQVGIVESFAWVDGPGAGLLNFFNHRLSLCLVKKHLDFLGVNHYIYHRFRFSLKHGFTFNNGLKGFPINGKLWVSDLGWTLYPRAIYEVLLNVSRVVGARHAVPSIPIYITENGLADEHDVSRQKFLEETLQWVKKAMDEGVDVRGYLHWSLLDNYEWAEGYKAKFGLVSVDFDHDQERTIRPSALWLCDFIKQKHA